MVVILVVVVCIQGLFLALQCFPCLGSFSASYLRYVGLGGQWELTYIGVALGIRRVVVSA